MDKLDLTALNALTQKVDSGLTPDNSHLITEEYNTLLSAVKAIGAKVNEVIDGGGSGGNIIITASANNSTFGSVTGTGAYQQFAAVTLTATANEGYYFEKWTDESGNTVSTTPTYNTYAIETKAYIAVFKSNAVGDVEVTMTTAGVITNLSATEDTILWSLNGAAKQVYTEETGYIVLTGGDKFCAVAKNSNTGVTGDDPVIIAQYDADADTLTITSEYDMTIDGVAAGKTYATTMTAGTNLTIVANGRTSYIQIING